MKRNDDNKKKRKRRLFFQSIFSSTSKYDDMKSIKKKFTLFYICLTKFQIYVPNI